MNQFQTGLDVIPQPKPVNHYYEPLPPVNVAISYEKPTIAYYRVSTKKQSLGLDVQQFIVKGFLGHEPDYFFIEKESGTAKNDSNRVQLKAALAKVKEINGKLIVAKLDRLSRSVGFINSLMESHVDFVVCDNPTISPVLLHITAAIAENEAKLISERTRNAYYARKRRCEELGIPMKVCAPEKTGFGNNSKREDAHGNPILTASDIRKLGAKSVREKSLSNQNNKVAMSFAKNLRDQGLTFNQIAEKLTEGGYLTSKGSDKWYAAHAREMVLMYDRKIAWMKNKYAELDEDGFESVMEAVM
jgi:DNA invertase Pin-like site-specific DNA recombinase